MDASAQSSSSESHAITFRTRGVTLTPQRNGDVERRIRTSLERFRGRVSDVVVLVEDINGPRGGTDMHCRIDLRLIPTGRLSVSAQADNELISVAMAVAKARTLLDRSVERTRTRRRGERIRNSQREFLN